MTGVYERALGDEAEQLHPRVRERHGVGPGDGASVGRGRMTIENGTLALPVLYAMPRWNVLFPESGTDVPFTVTTVGHRHGDYEAVATGRAFEFDGTRRRFDSLTLWDHDRERLLDFLGTPGVVVSELHPRVEDGALVVENGRQWLRIGERYLPIPGPFAVDVEVRERYDEDDGAFRIAATVESRLAGDVLRYRGTFTQTVADRAAAPDDLRPAEGVTALPPA